ncbi:hypothetical protein ABZ446_28710 [Streptomyces sp. NPDC005813]|uniref:DUF7848 domain-containing protein n=1 Tax=Streptomyces sp. NPDC005813 TaxID=3155592 RepID=UPI0034050154
MTIPLRVNVYAEVPATRIALDNAELTPRRWVECASCIEWGIVDEELFEAQQWALEHHGKNPGHDRFRIVRQTGWRLMPPSADEEAEEPPTP